MADRTAHRGSAPADRRCVRGCGGNNEKFAPERAGCETARANDEQQDTTTAISNTFEKQQYSLRRGNIDVASLLGIIAALTRELESKNVYIESNVRKMAALSDALERALCFETLWARIHLAEWTVAVGISLFAFCVYRAVLC